MKEYQFYVCDDSEIYYWSAETEQQAREQICEDWEITDDAIEAIQEVPK
jgi:hypothetical protein